MLSLMILALLVGAVWISSFLLSSEPCAELSYSDMISISGPSEGAFSSGCHRAWCWKQNGRFGPRVKDEFLPPRRQIMEPVVLFILWMAQATRAEMR